jgi:multidrug resistance efflux pump
MAQAPPKLRIDLTISRQGSGDSVFFILKDPATGNFFRFREAEYFIVRQCDGATPMEEVRRRAEKKFDTVLAPEMLAGFVRSLASAGLLTAPDGATVAAKASGRIQGDLFYLRFKLLDPSRLLRMLSPLVRFCFTPLFFAFSLLAILTAAAATLVNWDLMLADLLRLLDPSTIPLYVAVAFVTISMHEFAHGLACRHFGGDVREMGFLLMYFQPALYCNVSDAWLFTRKSQRLWVGFAGPYFELFVWAASVMIWRITDSETWVNRAALVVVASSGLKTLLNFNPLLKLDGYYLLSDYLEIPNLRKRAFRYLGTLLRRFVGLEHRAEEISGRERRIYLAYGLTAALVSFSLLGYVLLTSIITIPQGGAAAIFGLVTTGLVGVRARLWFRRIFKTSAVREDRSSGFEEEDEERPRESSSRRRRSRKYGKWFWRLAWLAAMAGAGYLGYHTQADLRVAGAFRILPAANADARTEVDGIVDRVFVDEGDPVKIGDLVARLSGKDLWASLQKIDAEIREAQAALDMLRAGPTAAETGVAEAELAKAEEQLRFSQGQLARAQTQLSAGVLSQNNFERAREQVINAEGSLMQARARLAAVTGSVRPEQIAAARARIARLEAEQSFIREQLRHTFILSPATGTVATPSLQLRQLPGQFVKKGDLITKIHDFRTVTAEILVPEKEISDVTIGQPVELRARAFPDMTFSGTVRFVATSAQGGSKSQASASILAGASGANSASEVLVTTAIDNRALILKPEMTGQAKIYIDRRPLPELVRRRLARMFKVEFWSWW